MNNTTIGANGLPVITSAITIKGNGFTIACDAGAPDFRILSVSPSGNLTLNATTISGGHSGYGGGIYNGGSTLTLNNSIVANNAGGDYYGTITSARYNLASDGSCNLTALTCSIPSGLANLGMLQVNASGNTPTHALLPGSQAIDAGNCSGGTITTDQRGVARPQGAACDIGAYELQAAVTYPFSGFFQPVDNPSTLNTVKAGSSIPVKFSLGGNQGLNIMAAGYPASQPITCDNSAPLAPIGETTANRGLTYDAGSGQYNYVWKTEKSWAGTCRQFILRLTDGTDHIANFKFN